MLKVTMILCLLLAGCSQQNETVKVAVPDTVRVCDTVYLIDTMLPVYKRHNAAYWIDDDRIRRVEWRVTVEWWKPADSIFMRDGGFIRWPGGWVESDLSLFYPDSLSACRALRDRYEKEKRELRGR